MKEGAKDFFNTYFFVLCIVFSLIILGGGIASMINNAKLQTKLDAIYAVALNTGGQSSMS